MKMQASAAPHVPESSTDFPIPFMLFWYFKHVKRSDLLWFDNIFADVFILIQWLVHSNNISEAFCACRWCIQKKPFIDGIII